MKIILILAIFALSPVGSFASGNSTSQKIQNSLWSAEVPRSVPLTFELPDEDLRLEKCDQFLNLLRESSSSPRSALEIYSNERSFDARFSNSSFRRQMRIHLPSDYNLLGDNAVEQLSYELENQSKPDYFQGSVDGLVPDLDAATTFTVRGAFEDFREKIGAPTSRYQITQESPTTILVNIFDRGLYCDLAAPNLEGQIHLQAYAPMPFNAQNKYNLLVDPLAKALNKVFNEDQSLRRRAALLGFQVGSVVATKLSTVTDENKEALAEKILDHVINFGTVTRSNQWVRSFSEEVPNFISQSADFPIEVNLVPAGSGN